MRGLCGSFIETLLPVSCNTLREAPQWIKFEREP